MKTITVETKLETKPAILLMGPPGGGKTTFMLQWPGLRVMDCDQNLAGPVRWLQSKGLFKPFEVETISASDDGSTVPLQMQWERLKLLTEAACKDPKVLTIGVDSLTHIDRMLQAHVKCKVLNKGLEHELGPYEWNPFKTQLYQFMMMVRSSGKTCIICCHEKIEYKDIQGTIDCYVPALSSNLKDYFGYIFTDIWRCEFKQEGAGQSKAIVRTHPSALHQLKNSLLMTAEVPAIYSEVEKYLQK